jgi:hypothetical protein
MLKNELKDVKIHKTKGLGGDGSDDFQNALRTILLHNKFPKNDLVLEEKLFALADVQGIEIAREFLENNANGIVLKDRGPLSHIVYAEARGLSKPETMEIHKEVMSLESLNSVEFGTLHLVLVAEDLELALNRIKDRQSKLGMPITERLENIEMQTKVKNGMIKYTNSIVGKSMNMVLIEVKPNESIEDVKNRVLPIVRSEVIDKLK